MTIMSCTVRSVFSLLALVSVAALPVPVRAAEKPELHGVYVAQGSSPDGSEYREFVQITRHGETFLVSWILAQYSTEGLVLELVSVGVGIVSGEVLAVSFYNAQAEGVVVYRIEADGQRLAGQWAVAGDGSVYAETLTKLPRPSSEPADADPPRDEGLRNGGPPIRPAGSLSL